jgi:hypothetical protein
MIRLGINRHVVYIVTYGVGRVPEGVELTQRGALFRTRLVT